MSRLLLSLFVLFTLCSPLAAQEMQGDSISEIIFMNRIGAQLGTKLTIAESQGKLNLLRFIDSEEGNVNKALISMTEEQKNGFNERATALGEAFEKHFSESGLAERLENLQTASPEEIIEFADELVEKNIELLDSYNTVYQEILTPQQIQLARKLVLTLPSFLSDLSEGDVDFVNFDAYNALDLSEEQNEAFSTLQKEYEELQNEISKMTPEPLIQELDQELKGEDVDEYAKRINAVREKQNQYGEKLKKSLDDILTKEQKEKLATLREEIPKKLASIREELEKKAKENPVDNSWMESWKPGDPIPEGATPPRPRGRFPLGI